MSDTIRPALTHDSRFLSEIMYESMLPGVGHGIFDAALEGLGVDPVSFGEALILEGANNWGQLQDFLIVEHDGRPAGACAAFRSNLADLRPLTGEGFEAVSRRFGWTPDIQKSFWQRYTRVFGMFGNSPQLKQPADYVGEYIAILEPYRGLGLGSALLRAQAERARSEGWETFGISAMFGNEPALGTYLRCGFEEAYRIGPEQYRGAFPGMIRLIMKL